MVKTIYDKPINPKWGKPKSFPPKSGVRQGCLLCSILIQYSARILSQRNTVREIKRMQIGEEEVKLPLFVDDMIL
jgi:hypothetical protein